MEGHTKSLRVSNTYRNIIQLSLPILVSLLIPQINNFTNTAFLGRYTNPELILGANGLATVYYLTVMMMGYGLVNGIQILNSKKAGEDNKKNIGYIFSNGIVIAVVFALLLILISWLVIPPFYSYIIQHEETKRLSIAYLQIRVCGLPFIVLAQLANSFFLSTSNSKRILWGSVAATFTNILLDYGLIFGNWGLPEMGLQGAAIASVCAEAMYAFVMHAQLFFSAIKKEYGITYFLMPTKKTAKEIIAFSLPLIVQYFFSIGAWELFFIYIEHLGKNELAISTIFRNFFGLVGFVTWGLASTCNSMVSNLIGQKKWEEVISLIIKVILLGMLYAVTIGIVVLIFPIWFLRLFTLNEALILQAQLPLVVVIIAIWFLTGGNILFNGVLGLGNTKVTLLFEAIAIVIYIVYIYFVIEKMKLSLSFAWASEWLYWGVLITLSTIYLQVKVKQNKILFT